MHVTGSGTLPGIARCGGVCQLQQPCGAHVAVGLPGLGRLPMVGGPWSRPHPAKPLPGSWCTETGEMAHAACTQLLCLGCLLRSSAQLTQRARVFSEIQAWPYHPKTLAHTPLGMT